MPSSIIGCLEDSGHAMCTDRPLGKEADDSQALSIVSLTIGIGNNSQCWILLSNTSQSAFPLCHKDLRLDSFESTAHPGQRRGPSNETLAGWESHWPTSRCQKSHRFAGGDVHKTRVEEPLPSCSSYEARFIFVVC